MDRQMKCMQMELELEIKKQNEIEQKIAELKSWKQS